MNKTPMVIVTIIYQKKESTLVEYLEDGTLTRKYVPTTRIAGRTVSEMDLSRGIPYGYQWEEINLKFDVKKFAHEMRKAGIWTAQDAMKYPQKLWGALRATLADNLKEILEIARSEIKGARNG